MAYDPTGYAPIDGVIGRSSPVAAVIAAAGSGERLGRDVPKALVEVAGKALVRWSMDAISRVEGIQAAVIAAPADRLAEVGRALVLPRPRQLEAMVTELKVVSGGASRAESVQLALEGVGSELVVIHDAARPLAPPALFEAVIEELRGNPEVDGVIAATPVADTIKRVEGKAIVATEDRSALWSAQTPQAFRTAALREAIAAAGADAATATDEAALIEWAGGVVAVEPAPATNLKVTTPDDLRLAEVVLQGR